MRILVINPNTTQSMTEGIGQVARAYARPGTEIVAVNPAHGPRSIEGHFEHDLAAVATVELVAGNRDQYDAFVIACFSAPGLYACREITDRPVIGIGEAALHLATFLGHKFSIVTVMNRSRPQMEDLVRQTGLESKCASVRCAEVSVLGLEDDADRAAREVVAEARKAVEEDGAEVICLGCAGMGTLAERIEAAVGVPALDGIVCAVKLAESFYDYGKRTSKAAAFAWPERKELVNSPPSLQAVSRGAPDGRAASA